MKTSNNSDRSVANGKIGSSIEKMNHYDDPNDNGITTLGTSASD